MPTVQSKFSIWLMLTFAGSVPVLSQSLVRLETSGLSIVTDAGEASARPLIDRVLEMKLAFPIEYEANLTVLVLTDRQRFQRIRPAPSAAAFFQRSAGESYIVLAQPSDLRHFRHEFVHFALDHVAAPLPLWLEEGLAEYYSTIEARADHLLAGRPVPEHLAYLRTQGIPPLLPILKQQGDPLRETYAAGWALAHMLQHDHHYRGRYGDFWRRLQQGEDSLSALRDAFGRPVAALERDLRAYVERSTHAETRIGLRGAIDAPVRVVATPLSPDEFDEHYIALARAMGRLDAVYAAVEQSAKRGKPGAQAVAAALRATAGNQLEEARAHWERAMDEGARGAEVLYEYAGVLRDTGAPESDIADALVRVVEVNPRFTPAHLWLAAIEGRRSRWHVAEKHLSVAAQESPRRFDVWYELAFARREQRKIDAARQAATKAVALAIHALDREKAQALLLTPAALPEPARPVTRAKSWDLPVGDRQVESDWLELICGDAAIVKLANGEEFTIRDPRQVSLQNAGGLSIEFQCGKQEPPRRVRIGYDSATREVRRLELLPAAP